MPQFDFICFGVLVWSLLLSLWLLYFFIVTVVLPFFAEIKKFRLKKNSEENFFLQTVVINKNMRYNIKLKKSLNY